MAIKDDIKKLRGLNNSNFDVIIDNYIKAAKKDLIAIGVSPNKVEDSDDPLIYDAINEFVLARIDEPSFQLMHYDSYLQCKDKLRHYSEYR